MPEFSFSELCSSAVLILFQCIHSLVLSKRGGGSNLPLTWRLFDWCYTCPPQHPSWWVDLFFLSAKQSTVISITLSHIAWQGTSASFFSYDAHIECDWRNVLRYTRIGPSILREHAQPYSLGCGGSVVQLHDDLIQQLLLTTGADIVGGFDL